MGKKKVTLSLDSKVYGDFRDYCEKNAVMLSKKIEIVMKEIMKGKKFYIFLFFIFACFSAYALTYQQSSQADFNNGTYFRTSHNGTGVVLVGNNVSGNYTSQVIDAGQLAVWNNITFSWSVPSTNYFLGVDASAGVFVSKNQNVNWSSQTTDYGDGGSGTNDMFADSSYLYIVFSGTNKRLYRSANLGVNWTLINDSFTGPSIKIGEADSNGNLYLLRGNGVVFKSNNSGISWTQVGDINPDTSTPRGLAINSSGALFAVDGGGSVYRSVDQGLNWTLRNSSYGGGSGTDDMAADSSGNLYILFNNAVYKSTDQGASWPIVNSSFSKYANDGAKIISVSNNLYIADAVGRTFISSDAGITWTELGDINNGATNGIKGFAKQLVKTNLTYQYRNCSSSNCADGVYVGVGNSSSAFFNSSSVGFSAVSRYFQYRVLYNTADGGFTPLINQAQIGYSYAASAPSLTITAPTSGQVFAKLQGLPLNYTVTNSSAISSCWYTLNDGATNISLANCQNTTFNVSGVGVYTVRVYANETISGLTGSASIAFSVSITAPNVSIASPVNGQTIFNINSIPLNFSISNVSAVSACWYSLNGGATNNSLAGCQNTTFNVPSVGNYSVFVYSNESILGLIGQASSNFSVNLVAPNVSIFSPNSTSYAYSSQPLPLNFTISNSTSPVGACWYTLNSGITNTSLANCQNINLPILNPGYYNVSVYANETALGLIGQASKNFSIYVNAPNVDITAPTNGQVFGNNQSLSLNFTISNSTSPVGACWYTLNAGVNNVTLTNCLNTSFNVSTSGNYTVTVYANETASGLIGSDNSTFNVQIGSPSIQLISPIGTYLNYTSNIDLIYTAQDNDLASCSLWADFSGTLLLVSTDNSVVSGATSHFYANLTDGNYMWQIICNDSASHSSSSGIETFYVDTVRPSVTIAQPSGTKTSLSGIPLTYSIDDASPTSCYYNVTFAVSGQMVVPNTILPGCNSTTFSVDTYSSYNVYVKSNDSAGNTGVANSSFIVVLQTESGGGGSSGGGSSGGVPTSFSQAPKISVEDLEKLEIRRGSSAELQFSVKNIGNNFLNNCGAKVDGFGNSESQIKQGIAPGQLAQYNLLVSVPRDAESGLRELNVIITCDESTLTKKVELEIPDSNFDFLVIDAKREGTKMIVSYSVKNYLDENQEINFVYRLLDSKGIAIYEGSEKIVLEPLIEETKSFSFELPKDSIGEFSLSFEVSSGEESFETQKDVILPRIGLAGFAVSESNRQTLARAGGVIAAVFVLFFLIRVVYLRFNPRPPKHPHKNIISKRKARHPFRKRMSRHYR